MMMMADAYNCNLDYDVTGGLLSQSSSESEEEEESRNDDVFADKEAKASPAKEVTNLQTLAKSSSPITTHSPTYFKYSNTHEFSPPSRNFDLNSSFTSTTSSYYSIASQSALSPRSVHRQRCRAEHKEAEEMLRKFRETAALFRHRMEVIFAESRRKTEVSLLGLRVAMTKNGYSESCPVIKVQKYSPELILMP